MSVPTVGALRVSPVKGLAQDVVDAVELVPGGIRNDRRFVCADPRNRRLYALDVGSLIRARARWDEAAGTLGVTFPDGSTVEDVVELGATEMLANAVGTHEARLVAGPFAEAMSEVAGRPLRLFHIGVGVGGPGPITVVGDGSLARLARELGLDELDSTRFRMSIELDGLDAHAEDEWDGALLRIGAAVVRIGGQVPRCAVITRDPATSTRDLDTLRVLLDYRGPMPTGEPPFGVYATVIEPGVVRRGDTAALVV